MPNPLIVVIDDDPPTTEMLSDVLSTQEYRVIICLSQKEAVAVIHRERPDLVLLDLWLETPTDGWTILAELAHDPDLATIPVIICTALPPSQIEPPTNLPKSPTAILHKPFEFHDLFSTIETALKK